MNSRHPARRLVLPALAALTLGGCALGSQGSSTTTPPALATAPVVSARASSTPVATPSVSPGGLVVVPPGAQVTVIAPLGLNMRAGPSTSTAIIGVLGQGAVLSVLGHQTGWYSVMGATKQGYVTDNPQFLSPRHFNQFSSSVNAFTLLYPDTWTFAETAAGVEFRPQAGAQVMTVRTAATLDAIGPPGKAGYTLVTVDSTEVYGVTGLLRRYDGTPGAGSGTPPPSATPAHLEQIRLSYKANFAMQIDYEYVTDADLAPFLDMVNSIVIPAAAATPAH